MAQETARRSVQGCMRRGTQQREEQKDVKELRRCEWEEEKKVFLKQREKKQETLADVNDSRDDEAAEQGSNREITLDVCVNFCSHLAAERRNTAAFRLYGNGKTIQYCQNGIFYSISQ